MPTIKLLSHAIPHSPFNSTVIIYGRGKPETVVEGDCEGLRERKPGEPVHLVNNDSGYRICTYCRKYAEVWMDSKDRWANHPARCS